MGQGHSEPVEGGNLWLFFFSQIHNQKLYPVSFVAIFSLIFLNFTSFSLFKINALGWKSVLMLDIICSSYFCTGEVMTVRSDQIPCFIPSVSCSSCFLSLKKIVQAD